jgi:excisionase family DNA binding protein
MNKELLTIGEAAELLGVSIQTLRRWDKHGKLKAVRHPMNKYRLYKRTDIQSLLERIGDHER